MTRYFFVILVMALIGVAIVVKAGITMFAERQYWQDVADRFVKENVTVKPNRGNIISSDGKLMASSLPEYRIYMDFMSGEKDEKRRRKDQARRDSILNANMDSICIGLHKIFPDKSAAQFKAHLKKGRQAKSRNYLIYPKRISYIQYKEVKRLPVFCLNRYKGGFKEQAYNQRKKPFGSLAARTLGDVYADTAKGARNGIELAFDTILKGRDGLTHRQKVMNKYLNIVDVPPVDGCDLISTIDVGMQDICEKALVDKLKELNASVGVVVLMEVATGEVKAIVNMMQGKDGEYYEMRNNAISDMLEPGSTFKTASIMVALEDGKITPEDRTMIGNPTPDFTYGLSLGVNYKNWSLGIDMMGQHGNEIFRTWDNYNFAQFNYLSQRMDRWHGEGTSNSQPLLNSKHSINNLNSEYYIEDGSFFRIRNVQLAYSFDKALLAKIRLQALKVYVNIQNLKTWKHNTGYTPELGGTATAFGVDNGSYPVPAVYTFGINLTF